MNADTLQLAILSFPIFLFSLVFHECAHALAGELLGDHTARQLGRLTLNPAPHIDPIGTIAFPLMGMLFGGLMFGWAKPVPFSPHRLRNPLRDAALIAFAGPLSNAVLAIAFAAAMRPLAALALRVDTPLVEALYAMARLGVIWNVILAWFNLLPIPPLDGSKVLAFFLPPAARERMWMAQSLGALPLFLIILIPGVASFLMGPAHRIIAALTSLALA